MAYSKEETKAAFRKIEKETLPPVFVWPETRKRYVAWVDWQTEHAGDGLPKFRKNASAIVAALKKEPPFAGVNPNKVSSWLVLPVQPETPGDMPRSGYLIHNYGSFSRKDWEWCAWWHEQWKSGALRESAPPNEVSERILLRSVQEDSAIVEPPPGARPGWYAQPMPRPEISKFYRYAA